MQHSNNSETFYPNTPKYFIWLELTKYLLICIFLRYTYSVKYKCDIDLLFFPFQGYQHRIKSFISYLTIR